MRSRTHSLACER